MQKMHGWPGFWRYASYGIQPRWREAHSRVGSPQT